MKSVIIGYGNIGKKRHKIIEENKIFDVKAIVEINNLNIKNLKESKNLKIFNSLENFFKSKIDVNIAIVCVNPKFSYKICQKLLNNKINIFIEKPPFFNFKEYKNILSIASKNKLLVKIGYNFLEDQNYKFVKEKLNYIGEIYNIKMSYKYGTNLVNKNFIGSFMDVGIHLISILNDLFENFKISLIYINKYEKNFDEWGIILCKCKKIDIILEHSLVNHSNEFNFEIVGQKGKITWEGLSKWGQSSTKIFKRKIPSGKPILKNQKVYRIDKSFKKELNKLKTILANKNKFLVSNQKDFKMINKISKFFITKRKNRPNNIPKYFYE